MVAGILQDLGKSEFVKGEQRRYGPAICDHHAAIYPHTSFPFIVTTVLNGNHLSCVESLALNLRTLDQTHRGVVTGITTSFNRDAKMVHAQKSPEDIWVRGEKGVS